MKKSYDINLINEILYKFINESSSTLIKPREVFEFSQKLYKNNEWM